jgi:hypothetical protein
VREKGGGGCYVMAVALAPRTEKSCGRRGGGDQGAQRDPLGSCGALNWRSSVRRSLQWWETREPVWRPLCVGIVF